MTDTTNEPFVRNAWYVAAWSEEIDEAPLGRTIINEPIVVFRDADGAMTYARRALRQMIDNDDAGVASAAE